MYIVVQLTFLHYILIKIHGSESWGQEASLHDEPVSYLQVAPL